MSALSDSDTPSLPSDVDETLTGPDRVIKLLKDQITMIRVEQHTARKSKREWHESKEQHEEVEHELLVLQHNLTNRVCTQEEWNTYEDLGEKQYELLSYIAAARTRFNDAMEQIEERMQKAYHYMNVLEGSNDSTWMDCDN